MQAKVKFTSVSDKNLSLQVTGIVDPGASCTKLQKLFSMNDAELAQLAKKRLRIDSVLFILQEKMGILLWWDEGDLILPLESRGAMSFNHPIVAPKDWKGAIWWSAFKVDERKHFYFTLDCEPL